MIFDIHAGKNGVIYFVEPLYIALTYQAWEALDLMHDCGFNNVGLVCFEGYENAVAFVPDTADSRN